ncbi:glycosyltransferase family 2 protein [Pseudooceanicola sp.]|uniref:glycosyltransferase family 2 protein n=1 Tax=Pseudooceanicola sp. TaxID=1914328 RepID=UPI003515ACC2
MRIVLHIGPDHVGAPRLQQVMDARRDALLDLGVLYAHAPGSRNHTRLYMAVTDPDHVDPLRFNRGFEHADRQALLRETVTEELAREVDRYRPETLILSAAQLGSSLHRRSELARLHAMLMPLSDDIRIVAHIDEPARLLTRIYADQIFEGRATPLEQELTLARGGNWWVDCIERLPQIDPAAGQFEEVQGAPFWLDYPALVEFWEGEFGLGSVSLRSYDAAAFAAPTVTDEICTAFGVDGQIGLADSGQIAAAPSAAWLARGRQLNALLLRLLKRGDRILPRQLWRSFVSELEIGGDAIDPGSLAAISTLFRNDLDELVHEHPGLSPSLLRAPKRRAPWAEADPGMGFRASQYLVAYMYRIDRATESGRTPAEDTAEPAPTERQAEPPRPSPAARAVMPPLAMRKYETLKTSSYAPHNRLGRVNEEDLAAAFDPAPPRLLPEGSSGNVIVGCMKNEAPYIVEWVAYHRAIGVDNFLIYTNGCEDGTDQILDRLQEMGVVHHRLNDDWQGNSPQQHALNRALDEAVIKTADWIIHIDVDEFINVRCGNGTLDDLFARAPQATNIAMTWRLFGHNDIRELRDDFVIDQFETCAPKYCPKPHTVWGFKTMFRNIGAYEKISCHRPNKLAKGFEDKVRWVNGSGRDMTQEAAKNGWRNSKKSIGYDLVQLNHYALRSAESFLIKRQRGRALHVDRSIGLNYWIRMDWSDHRDLTIKRNIPRLRAEYDRLMSDPVLRARHDSGLDWHRAKAAELHGQPEFQELYEQALKVRLNGTERAAYALALDMES